MSFRNICLSALAVCLLASCDAGQPSNDREDTPEQQPKPDDHSASYTLLLRTQWLLGAWKGVPGKGVSAGNWRRQNDSVFSGAALFIKGSASFTQESIVLVQAGKQLLYIPTVKANDASHTDTFSVVEATESSLVVQKSSSTFPQKIAYTLYSPDSLVVALSGTLNGQLHTELFPMKKSL